MNVKNDKKSHFSLTLRDVNNLLKEARERFGDDIEAVYFYFISTAITRYSYLPDGQYIVSYLYQKYFDTNHKELNIKKQKHQKVAKSDINIATQFFTPKQISKYIVENSLGALLYQCGYDFNLEYLDKTNLVFGSKAKNIKTIKIFDPAVGTGNLLYEAVELMLLAFKKDGYSAKECENFIKNNVFGIDIDDKVGNLCNELSKIKWKESLNIITSKDLVDSKNDFLMFGSLIDENNIENSRLKDILTQKYDIILMNPPYLTSSDYGTKLKNYIYKKYSYCKTDLYAVFVCRFINNLKADGYFGILSPYNWMFIKQFAEYRQYLLSKTNINNLAMMPSDVYKGAVVFLSAFVLSNRQSGVDKGIFIKVPTNVDVQEYLKIGSSNYKTSAYYVHSSLFNKTPSNSILFWIDDNFLANFSYPKLSEYMDIRQGLATGNNKKYLKKISEVDISEVDFSAKSTEEFIKNNKKYALYNKGGKYRKWFGNREYVILFDKDARERLAKSGNKLPSRNFYFHECITWTLVSTKSHFGARYSSNAVFDVGGSCGFPKNPDDIYVILAYLCSNVASYYLRSINPTINCQVGDIKMLPYIDPEPKLKEIINKLAKRNVSIAKLDWESYENGQKIQKKQFQEMFLELKENERQLNHIFNNLYKLSNLSDDVPDDLITLKSY